MNENNAPNPNPSNPTSTSSQNSNVSLAPVSLTQISDMINAEVSTSIRNYDTELQAKLDNDILDTLTNHDIALRAELGKELDDRFTAAENNTSKELQKASDQWDKNLASLAQKVVGVTKTVNDCHNSLCDTIGRVTKVEEDIKQLVKNNEKAAKTAEMLIEDTVGHTEAIAALQTTVSAIETKQAETVSSPKGVDAMAERLRLLEESNKHQATIHGRVKWGVITISSAFGIYKLVGFVQAKRAAKEVPQVTQNLDADMADLENIETCALA